MSVLVLKIYPTTMIPGGKKVLFHKMNILAYYYNGERQIF